jgi:lipoyl(octanoyl) transferase
MIRASTSRVGASEPTLHVYLLGNVEFEAALRFQRRLHFEVCDERIAAALVLCEHPPTISIGRLGSHGHIRGDDDARGRRFPLRWVNRGGGCILHLPGQLAVYPILPLDRLGLDVPAYLERLSRACLAVISDFSLRHTARADQSGVWVGERLIAVLGVAVRDWVSTFGAYINVQPSLDPFRQVRTSPAGWESMTSLQRERRGPVRPSMVRQRLVEHFQACFAFPRVALFSDHPALTVNGHRCNGTAAVDRALANWG